MAIRSWSIARLVAGLAARSKSARDRPACGDPDRDQHTVIATGAAVNGVFARVTPEK
jgi:hypothetical protein